MHFSHCLMHARCSLSRPSLEKLINFGLGMLYVANVMFQNYVFSTYDLQNANIEATLTYNDELEGTWRYIYMAYSRN